MPAFPDPRRISKKLISLGIEDDFFLRLIPFAFLARSLFLALLRFALSCSDFDGGKKVYPPAGRFRFHQTAEIAFLAGPLTE
jgi:hypothetical protein